MSERRRFSRIRFDAPAHLTGPAGRQQVQVLDISLKGVFVAVGPDWAGEPQAHYRLTLELAPGTTIAMDARLAHTDGENAGFRCERIDLDSMAHLRAVAECNLADPELLQRELEELGR